VLLGAIVEVGKRFARKAESAGISEAMAAAAGRLSEVVSDALGTMGDALDFLPKLLDSRNFRFPSDAEVDQMVGTVLDFAQRVQQRFLERAQQINLSSSNASAISGLAGSFQQIFDAVAAAIDAFKKFSETPRSGLNIEDFSLFLDSLFAMFNSASSQAGGAQAIADALTSIVGAMQSLGEESGTAIGESLVDALAAAIRAGAGDVQSALSEVLSERGTGGGTGSVQLNGGGGTGSGQGQIVNNVVNNFNSTVINFSQTTTPDVAAQAGLSIAGIKALF
jgi:AcrR family transcriptional regulator